MFKKGNKVRLCSFEEAEKRGGLFIAAAMKQYFGKKYTIIDTHELSDGRRTFYINIDSDTQWEWYEGWSEDIDIDTDKIVEYTFRDEGFDIFQLCADAFEDNMKAFLVVGDSVAFIGVLGSDIVIDTEHRLVTNETVGNSYNVAEIELKDVGFWRKKLIQFSKDYDVWRKELNDNIKDRSRVKVDDKKFKVMGFGG